MGIWIFSGYHREKLEMLCPRLWDVGVLRGSVGPGLVYLSNYLRSLKSMYIHLPTVLAWIP